MVVTAAAEVVVILMAAAEAGRDEQLGHCLGRDGDDDTACLRLSFTEGCQFSMIIVFPFLSLTISRLW